jgi:hypothetical protein
VDDYDDSGLLPKLQIRGVNWLGKKVAKVDLSDNSLLLKLTRPPLYGKHGDLF